MEVWYLRDWQIRAEAVREPKGRRCTFRRAVSIIRKEVIIYG